MDKRNRLKHIKANIGDQAVENGQKFECLNA